MATLATAVLTLSRFSSSSLSSSKSFFTHTHRHRLNYLLLPALSNKTLSQQHRPFCCTCNKGMATSTTATSDSDRVTAPYGSWKSPITADVVSGASKKLGGTAVDGRGRLIWLESRPTEGG